MPVPIVYPANAHKIGLLEKDAMDVAIVYGLLDIARDGAARLITTYRTPDDISPRVVLKTAEAFLEACKYAQSVLPGVASHDDRDDELLRKINAAAVPHDLLSILELRNSFGARGSGRHPTNRSSCRSSASMGLGGSMFGWLKRKASKSSSDGRLPPFVGNMVEPLALAEAISEAAKRYMGRIASRTSSVPAIERKNSSVAEIWEDTRIEAAFPVFKHGAAQISLLADIFKQPKLFNEFVDDRPHLEFPHTPNGEPFHDTLQAVFQGFIYLRELGEKVGARFARERGFFDEYERKCAEIRSRWREYEAEITGHSDQELPAMPPPMIYIFWEEITRLAKEVAICSKFGTIPEKNLLIAVKRIRAQHGADAAEAKRLDETVREMLDQLQRARHPNDLASDGAL